MDPFTDGYCPQCGLEGRRIEMRLNSDDSWECPECHLQAHSRSAGMFAIIPERGTGQLKETGAVEWNVGKVLCRARRGKYNLWEAGDGFRDEDDLTAFLQNEVAPFAGEEQTQSPFARTNCVICRKLFPIQQTVTQFANHYICANHRLQYVCPDCYHNGQTQCPACGANLMLRAGAR